MATQPDLPYHFFPSAKHDDETEVHENPFQTPDTEKMLAHVLK